jgi:hypothetical protein
MPATITLKLNDTASGAIDELRSKLISAEEATARESEKAYQVAAKSSQQYKVLLQERARMAQTVVVQQQAERGLKTALEDVNTATDLATKLAVSGTAAKVAWSNSTVRQTILSRTNEAAIRSVNAAQSVLTETIGKNNVVAEQLNNTLNTTRASLYASKVAIENTATPLARYTGLLSGASRALGALGLVYAGAKAATTGYAAVLSRTGIITEQNTNATNEQRQAYERLSQVATATGETLQQVLTRYGKTQEDVGLKTTSNLDRLNTAWSTLSRDVSGNLRALVAESGSVQLPEFIFQMSTSLSALREVIRAVPVVIREVDAAATRGTANAVENTKLLRDALVSITGGQALADATKYNAEMQSYRERTIDDFNNFREINTILAESEKERQESTRLASLATVEAITQEIKAQKEKAGTLAGANEFTDEEFKKTVELVYQLETQKRKAIEETAEKEKKIAAELRDIREKDAEYGLKLAEERAKAEANAFNARRAAYMAVIDAERQQEIELADFRRSLLFRGAIESENAAVQEAERKLKLAEDEKADLQTINRLKRAIYEAQKTAHELRVREIEMEATAAMGAAQSELDQVRAAGNARKALAEEEYRFKRELRQREVNDKRAAEQAKIDAEKKKQDNAKQVLEQAGITPQNVLQSQNPRQVREAIAQRRQAEARQKFNEQNSEQIATARQQEAQGDPRAVRQLLAQRNRQEAQARRGAFNDFNQGRTGASELTQGQTQVAQESIKALQSQGKVSQEVATVLRQQIQATAEQQAATEALLQQVRQLQQVSGQQARAASGQRARAIKGSN